MGPVRERHCYTPSKLASLNVVFHQQVPLALAEADLYLCTFHWNALNSWEFLGILGNLLQPLDW